MTDQKNGPWTVIDTRTGFENPWLRIESSHVIHPDGSAGTYGVVRYANLACGVLPIDDDGHTWIVGQHRFPFNAYSWELPEGGGAMDMSPEASALRELTEETGLSAAHSQKLGRWHLSNSVTDEVAHGFLVWGLSAGTATPEPSEALQVKRIPVRDLARRLRAGEIMDAFTHLMLMSAIDLARRGEIPEQVAQWLRDA